MEDPTILELLGIIRNSQSQIGNLGKDEHPPPHNQQLQPALYQLNLIKESLECAPGDASGYSSLQSGLPQCSVPSNVPSCSEQGLAPCSAQSGLLSCVTQSSLTPSGLSQCSDQSGLPQCSVPSNVPSCSEQSGLPPCSAQSGLLSCGTQSSLTPSELSQCSDQSGLPQCSEQSHLPLCSVQAQILPCDEQSGLLRCSEQSHLPLCSDQSQLPLCDKQSGLVQCNEQLDLKGGLSGQPDSSKFPGQSFIDRNTSSNQTGVTSTCISGEGQASERFEGKQLAESSNSFLISQIAHVAHRVQPNQEYEYAITKHKIVDILSNPFMCGICGNIFKATALLQDHVAKDHCLSIPQEHGRWDEAAAGSKRDQNCKKQEDSLLDTNTSDATSLKMNKNKLTEQKRTDLTHPPVKNKILMHGKESSDLKDTFKPRKEKNWNLTENGEKTQLEGGIHDTTDTERSLSNEISFQKKNKFSLDDGDLKDFDRVEGQLKELKGDNSNPIRTESKHKGSKRFQCEFCEEVFTSNRYRFKHRVASHPDCMFACPSCDKTFKVHEKDKWQHHVRIHNKPPKKPKPESYSCRVCSMVFRAASSVAIHMQTFHPENVQVERPFCCEVCGKLFRTKRAIKLHQTLVHSDKKPFECPTCGRGFKMESYLKLHLRTHTGEKPYACKFCDKTFPSTAGRRSHERSHTNERPYKCSYCGRGFKAKPQLDEHVRTHTKEKPFVCPVCDKAFASRTSFATHKFLHTGARPFKCTSCSRAFAQKCNLEHHVRSIHTLEKPYQCTICGLRFSRSTGRSMHMEKKHGIKISQGQGRPSIFPEVQEIDQIVQASCVSIDVTSAIMGPTMLEDTLSLVVESLNG